jgi:integrase/recombinase XerD
MSSVMAQRLRDYLAMRRGLGFKLVRDGEVLADFVAYLGRVGATTITTGVALAWATAPEGADPSWWVNRLRAARGFARYLANLDPATEIPPTHLLPPAPHRAVPYIYSVAEIAALLEAAADIHTRQLAPTYRTLIGLLAVTGMRISEALNLDCSDLDLGEGLLVVRDSKFGKSRELALHSTTVRALREYAEIRDRDYPRPRTAAWFVSSTRDRLTLKTAEWHFRRLTRTAGLLPRSEKCRPRIHDLRHTFAVNTLLGWYRDGVDVQARLPLLSAYLGHVHPGNTYWYLTATPELMHLVAQRLDPIGPVR